MTSDAIREIKKAEENGAQLIINAQIEANYRVERATEEFKKAQYDEENRFETELEKKLNEARAKADKTMALYKEASEREASELEKKAKSNMPNAIKLVLEVIKESWQ